MITVIVDSISFVTNIKILDIGYQCRTVLCPSVHPSLCKVAVNIKKCLLGRHAQIVRGEFSLALYRGSGMNSMSNNDFSLPFILFVQKEEENI